MNSGLEPNPCGLRRHPPVEPVSAAGRCAAARRSRRQNAYVYRVPGAMRCGCVSNAVSRTQRTRNGQATSEGKHRPDARGPLGDRAGIRCHAGLAPSESALRHATAGDHSGIARATWLSTPRRHRTHSLSSPTRSIPGWTATSTANGADLSRQPLGPRGIPAGRPPRSAISFLVAGLRTRTAHHIVRDREPSALGRCGRLRGPAQPAKSPESDAAPDPDDHVLSGLCHQNVGQGARAAEAERRKDASPRRTGRSPRNQASREARWKAPGRRSGETRPTAACCNPSAEAITTVATASIVQMAAVRPTNGTRRLAM